MSAEQLKFNYSDFSVPYRMHTASVQLGPIPRVNNISTRKHTQHKATGKTLFYILNLLLIFVVIICNAVKRAK